jgi:FixJ family two-component response regulator
MSIVESPDSVRWSLCDLTRCNQQGYMRPCQSLEGDAAADATVPLSAVCETDAEAVFVVDEDADLRASLVATVESLGYRAISCANAGELQAVVGQWKTGCILLEVRLSGQDGLAVQEWLNRVGISLPVIFISGIQDVPVAVEAMKAGAIEFLSKPVGEMVLRRAVSEAVAQSRKRFCRNESEQMVRAMLGTLTPTEILVAARISQGYPTKLIASHMDRSENTVKIHRHRIFQKLKVNSAASVANLMHHAAVKVD